jgi:DNA-binding MarR family transcriptional regulator/N-acetylglutamate synthase-like GNAT family acetyltransferase
MANPSGRPAGELARRIDEVREFNRFYTRLIGVLGDGHLASPFSLAQVRVMYELAHRDAPTASELSEDLALDPGYLSRMLRELERGGLVSGRRSAEDARRRQLALTAKGKRVFGDLERKAEDAIGSVLAPVAPARRRELTQAMRQIRAALEPEAAAAAGRPAGAGNAAEAPFVLRTHRPGDLGWIVHRHGALYAQEHGWDERFEALVAGIVARFVERFDPERERCWIAERDGAFAGSIMLVSRSKTVAQLRLLLVEPAARGSGLGRRLVAECTRFARDAGYRKIVLWTNSVLESARRLYVAEGYRLVHEEPHDLFGPDLAQTWELRLADHGGVATSQRTTGSST